MVTELVAGANLALPGARAGFAVPGPFDLSALVLGADGRVAGDGDMVFYNQPSAPGVGLRGAAIDVATDRLRPGAERVVVLASPEAAGLAFGSLPAPELTATGPDGRPFARFRAGGLRTETAAQLVEVYRRAGRWRLRAIGQGYADGLGGLVRDFGVDVAEEPPPPAPAPGGGPLAEVVAATNVERARHGLPALTVDARLGAAAQDHSDDMVRRAFFSHDNPDGAQVWDRALARGYRYRKVAENIAAGQRSAADVVAGWMDSPGHRANILDRELTQIGVGHALGGGYGTTWTQVFGTPL
ncbi:CAP domain-containing protein [Pseudonocardia humida]|uniref:TerD family protein n=1 Tax=Pseudonocardia humida TaxID=2800819 RepID=A0ABT1A7Y9_9PSEU|nr:CAP domain-containing protein [Pseudonocardia humida]MCO1659147.1 TerD family protein [Pseudonocardia humida]